jgi:hypothetical protein
MGEASSERRAIIENIFWPAFTATELFMEGIELIPEFENSLFFGRKVIILTLLDVLHGSSDVFQQVLGGVADDAEMVMLTPPR